MQNKAKVIKDYDKLPEELIEQIKLYFPYGFEKKLVTFKNKDGKFISALPFEGEQFHYLIRMTKEEAQEIIEEDDDYNEDGNLKDEVQDVLSDKYEE